MHLYTPGVEVQRKSWCERGGVVNGYVGKKRNPEIQESKCGKRGIPTTVMDIRCYGEKHNEESGEGREVRRKTKRSLSDELCL
jgi:hypothetical protein